MRNVSALITLISRISLVFFCMLLSCQPDEKLLADKEIKFSFTNQTTSGRTSLADNVKGLIITITDNTGNTVVDRKELALYKFGDSFLSLPITLKTTGATKYKLSEFLVTDTDNKVIYVTPKEASKLAHLVADPLDIEFVAGKDAISTITPQVVEADDNTSAIDYGYGQFGFNIVKKIDVVFSSFIKEANNFKLTDSHLKIEGLRDTLTNTPADWVYETDLEAKANLVTIQKAYAYRITATKKGYSVWTETKVLTNASKIEILLEEAQVDVYVAGYMERRATYWKNGIPFKLSNSLSYCNSIYVSNNDVYISGNTEALPQYWKNGESVNLQVPASAVRGETLDIITEGTDVYVCGSYTDSNHLAPVYWKNGERIDLQIPSSYNNNGVAKKIFIDGADVYVAGYVLSSNTYTNLITAALWKNGEFIHLPRPANYQISNTNGVDISNGHVYVSGYIAGSPYDGSTLRAVYWKDGAMQFIPSTSQSFATSLDVDGNDVYIPYSVYDPAQKIYSIKYLKNGEEVLVDQGTFATTYDVTISNHVVYLAGTYGQLAVAAYWADGKRVLLTDKESQAMDCFVVSK
jgi:hypothetical protein